MKNLLCVLLVIATFISCQSTSLAAKNTDQLPSGIAYSEIKAAIDAYVSENESTTAAVSIAVFNRNEVLMEKSYGYTNIEEGIVNGNESVFEWGSCTKLLTWVSAMQLSEKGALDLKRDIRTYLPEGFLKKLNYETPITFVNLMNHNAGWQETATDLWLENRQDIKDLGEALQLIEPEQVNKPGTVVAYSNWGTALAGYIVECISGQPFSEYVRENIFEPLGMNHTALSSDLSDNQWVSEKRDQEKCYTADVESLGTYRFYLSLYPAGMATGTLSDFLKFAQAFVVEHGEPSPLFKQTDTLDDMLSPSLYYADGKTARNCHGLWTDEFGVSVLWHYGATLGSSSWLAFDPETGIGIVILTNQKGEAIYNCGLLPKVFGKYEHLKSEEESADISGVYVSSRSCFKGYTKLNSLFSIIQISPYAKGGYTVSGGKTTIKSIGLNSYLMDRGRLKQSIIYADTSTDGQISLQFPGQDYLKVNGNEIIGKYIILLLLIVAAVYSFIEFIIIAFLSLKRKKLSKIDGYRTFVNLAVILASLLFIYVAVKLFTSNSVLFLSIQWALIVITVLALSPVIYTIILAVKWKGLNITKWKKTGLIIGSTMGLVMTFNVIFWEVYKFW